MDERRLFKRVKFESNSNLEIEDKSYEGDLTDISLRGALFYSDQDIPLNDGDNAILRIYLPPSDITLTFDVLLAHRRDNSFGFKFISEDIDTITHLRRLLELNLGEDGDIGLEITHWLKSYN